MTNSAGKLNLIEKYKEKQKSGEEFRQKAREAGEQIKESAQSKVVRGFIGGAVTAVNEGREAIDDIYDSFAGNPYDNEDLINLKKTGLKIDSDEGDWRYEVPHMIGQYVLPGAYIFKGLKFLPLAARAYTSGAIVDAFLTDPYEKNLFNIGVEHGPTFLKPLLNVFAAPDEEANVHIARLRAVGAGAIQGKVIGESVQAGVGVIKGAAGAVKDSGSSLLDGFIDKVLEMRNNPSSRERMTKALKEYEQLSLSDVQEVDQMIGSKKFLSDTETAERPLRGTVSLEFPDTRGKGEFYHGAADEFKLDDSGHFSTDTGIYGQGLYSTDDLTTAGKYQKKNRKTVGKDAQKTIYKVEEKTPVNFYDLDQPLDDEVLELLQDAAKYRDGYVDEAIELVTDFDKKELTLTNLFDKLRGRSEDFNVTRSEFQEILDIFKDSLREKGFGGFTHQGGNKAGKGKRLHQVKIYWDPQDQLDINKVDTSSYEKPITGKSVKGAPVKGAPVDQTYNPKTIKTADDLKDLLLSRLEKYKQKQASLQQGDFPVKRTFPEMARAARNQLPQDTVLSLERFVDNFGPGGREDLPALIISMNDLVHEVLTNVGDLTKQMDQTLATGNRVRYDEIKEDFAANLKVFDGLINIHKTTKSILGQSLAANKVPADAGERVTDIQSLFGRTSEEKFLDQAQNLRSSTDNLYDDPLTEFNIDEILKIADNGDTKQLRTLIRKIQIASNNPNALKTLIKEGGGTRFLKITNEIFVNSILSSPITHQVNMLSTALNTLARPIELALGAEDSISRARAGRELIYMVQSSVDSMKMAVAALRAEDNILDAGAMVSDVERFAIRMSGSGPLAKLTNGIGTLYRLPSRFLLAEDEFFKQLNFRSFAMAEAWEKGTRKGLQGAGLEKYMNEQFNGIISIVNKQSKEGVFSKEILDLYERARKFAAETTFTADLGKGTFSGDFQSFVSKHPTARLFFPFVRTPINILKSTFRRTPGVNRLMKEHMDALKSTDPSVRARAIGETKVGGTMWGLGITTAAAINVENAPIAITGGGPKDFNALNQKRATGWQPYSFRFLIKDNEFENVAKTGKANEIIELDQDTKLVRGADGKLKYRYVSYKRLDPWASFLSMSADAAEIGGHLSGGEYKNLADVMMVALARNLTEKTYLQGLTELTGLLDNEQKLSTWLGRRLAAITNPVSAMGRDTKKLFGTTPSGERAILDKKVRPGDATGPMVLVRRYFNELAATVPGWNNDMPAIQNWITGKYVEYPIGFGKDNWNVITDGWSTKTKSINDPVLSVLADLEANFQAPLDEFLDGQIKLTHRQYANLVYKTASLKRGGGLRLYDRLLKEINKTRIQGEIQIARGFEITNGNEDVAVGASEDSRQFVLEKLGDIVREYKEAAKREFLNLPENKEIKKKFDQQIILQNKLRKEMLQKNKQSNSLDVIQAL